MFKFQASLYLAGWLNPVRVRQRAGLIGVYLYRAAQRPCNQAPAGVDDSALDAASGFTFADFTRASKQCPELRLQISS